MITADTGISIAVVIPMLMGMAALLWRVEWARQISSTSILQLKYDAAITYATKDGVTAQTMQLGNEIKYLNLIVKEEVTKLNSNLEKLYNRLDEQSRIGYSDGYARS